MNVIKRILKFMAKVGLEILMYISEHIFLVIGVILLIIVLIKI